MTENTPKDHFPRTQISWIEEKLGEGHSGWAEVNHHVMSVYAWPLQVYFKGTSDRWLGEPEDIVQGFFADRLSQSDFFARWQESGKRLRYWLINAFNYYLMELRRKRRRDARDGTDLPKDMPTFSGNPETEVDRTFKVAIVRRALQQAQEECESHGFSQHWQVFMRHYYQDMAYKELADEFRLPPERLAVMARTATKRFQEALWNLLARDGITPDKIERELQFLLEDIRS